MIPFTNIVEKKAYWGTEKTPKKTTSHRNNVFCQKQVRFDRISAYIIFMITSLASCSQ